MKVIELEDFTDKTFIDKDTFLQQIKQIKHLRHAISNGEVLPGALNISAHSDNYICPAVLNILRPEYRLKPRATEFLEELKVSAARISNNVSKGRFVKAKYRI